MVEMIDRFNLDLTLFRCTSCGWPALEARELQRVFVAVSSGDPDPVGGDALCEACVLWMIPVKWRQSYDPEDWIHA